MADAQERVQTLLDDLVRRDVERGVQAAAYLDGTLVVDAWAGVADAVTGRLVGGDTLFTVFSVTKGITATVIHLLAARDQLTYDTPVADVWPEFAAHGKDRITVRHVLTHTAGIPQMPPDVNPGRLCDWEGMCGAIAALRPLWEAGTQTGYHSWTFGWILGEVARRVDGRPIAQIVQEDVCRPLGIDSLYFGIPDAAEPHVAVLEDAPARRLPDLSRKVAKLARGHYGWRTIVRRAVTGMGTATHRNKLARAAEPPAIASSSAVYNRPDVRRATLPAGGGIMNARALARHYAAQAGGTEDGTVLLTPERVRLASALQTDEVDLVLGVAMRKGLGYLLGGPFSPMGERITAFGHPGAGGSIGFADPAYRFAFGLTKNRMTARAATEDTAYLVAREVRRALGIPEGP